MAARAQCAGDGTDSLSAVGCMSVSRDTNSNNVGSLASAVKRRQQPVGRAPIARIESLYMYDESEMFEDPSSKQQKQPLNSKSAQKYVAPPETAAGAATVAPVSKSQSRDVTTPNGARPTGSEPQTAGNRQTKAPATNGESTNNNAEMQPLLDKHHHQQQQQPSNGAHDTQLTPGRASALSSPKSTGSNPVERSERLGKDLQEAVLGDNAARTKTLLKRDSVTSALRLKTLHAAVARGSNKVVKSILDTDPTLLNQADPDDESTALLVAVEAGNVSTVSLLAERGAKLDAKNNAGESIWDLHRRLHPVDNNGLLPTLVGLFKKHRKDYPTTPIHEAAAVGDVEKIDCLLDAGLDQWVEDRAGYTFIHIAAFNNRVNVIRHYVGADRQSTSSSISVDKSTPSQVDHRNPTNGKTALHVAANRGHIESVLALLKCGARPAATDAGGWTALHDAVVCRHEINSPGVIRALCVHALDLPSMVTADGETPLHVAARHGRLAAVRMLVELEQQDGTPLTLQDNDGWTPLHSAVDSKRSDVVEQIIDAINSAFDVHSLFEMTDKLNRTPLQLAQALPDNDDVIALLQGFRQGNAVKC